MHFLRLIRKKQKELLCRSELARLNVATYWFDIHAIGHLLSPCCVAHSLLHCSGR